MTGTEIAEMFGVSLSSYHGYVRRYIKREHPPKGVKRKSLESMGEVIIRLLNDGKTNSEIQKELGIVDSSLASFIKRHNLKSIRLRNKSYNLENSVIHKNNIADSVVSAESIVDTLIKKITDYEIKIEEQRKALVGFADKVVELDAKLTPLENENKALKEKYNNLLKQTTTQSEQVARLQNILARPS
jgi:chromosome segregation ATPase